MKLLKGFVFKNVQTVKFCKTVEFENKIHQKKDDFFIRFLTKVVLKNGSILIKFLTKVMLKREKRN